MPRILAASLALGLWALAGTAWGQPPDFLPIFYATDPSVSPRCKLPFDPAEFLDDMDPDKPFIKPPEVPIPQGSAIPLDLCFINWSPSPFTGECPPFTDCFPCSNGTGAKTCALKFVYSVTMNSDGITIQSATAAGVPGETFPDFEIMWDAMSLSVMGGDPMNGQNGNGVEFGFPVATVTLRGDSIPGTFEFQSGKLANEKLETVDLTGSEFNTVIAEVVPEPGMTIMLVSGIALLLAIGRSRIQP